MKNTPKRVIKMEKKSSAASLQIISTVFSIILLVLGVVGLFLIQTPLEQSTDIRRDASVASGQVQITTTKNNAEINLPDAFTDTLVLNTNGVQTTNIRLLFNVVSEVLSAAPVITPAEATSLDANFSVEVESTADGYLVEVNVTPVSSTSALATTYPESFLNIQLEADQPGEVTLNFDQETSSAFVIENGVSTDQLTHVQEISYTFVAANGDQTDDTTDDTDTTDDMDNTDQTDETNNDTTDEETDQNSESNNQVSDTTSTNQTGGTIVASCNQVCTSNNDCAVNHRCYNSRCRLVTNVSSTQCLDEQTNSATRLVYTGCDSVCNTSSECASGYLCFENRCRRTDNPDSASCAEPTTTVITKIIAGCNAGCSANSDCATNLRCYDGQCRLATNPSSTSCSASTTTNVSGSVYGQKGSSGASGNTAGNASGSGTIGDSNSATGSGGLTDLDQDALDREQTALETVSNTIKSTNIAGIPLPYILIAAGGTLLALIILSALLGSMGGGSSRPRPTKMAKAPRPQPTPSSANDGALYDLKNKINSLEAQQSQPGATPAGMTPPPPAPGMSSTAQSSLPPRPMPQQPTAQPQVSSQPPHPQTNATPSQTAPQSMADRLKAKGVTPPTPLPKNPTHS